MIFAFLNYFRLIIKHTIKTGYAFWSNLELFINLSSDKNSFYFVILFLLFLWSVYKLQKLSFKVKIMTETKFNLVLVLIHTLFLIFAVYLVNKFKLPFIICGIMNMYTMLFLLKMISFCHVLSNIRFYSKCLKGEIKYEKLYLDKELSIANKEIIMKNIKDLSKIFNLKSFLYFLAAPTLCFQLSYPRTPKIRWIWLFKRIFELVML